MIQLQIQKDLGIDLWAIHALQIGVKNRLKQSKYHFELYYNCSKVQNVPILDQQANCAVQNVSKGKSELTVVFRFSSGTFLADSSLGE